MPRNKKGKPAHIQFTTDEFGREILLKDGSLQVMMEWERPYMEACIDALKPTGNVLEIGFGLGYSATRIQTYHPRSHTIIECEPAVIEKAREWAKDYLGVEIVEGFWQDQLTKLGTFDTIFFDDYTPLSPEEAAGMEADAKACQKQQKEVRKTLDHLRDAFKAMKGVKFSDAQIADFLQYLSSRKEEVSFDAAQDFVQTLVEQGNMTMRQELLFLDAFEKANSGVNADTKETAKADRPAPGDRLLAFYQLCLDNHMSKGARLSSYIDLKQFKNNYGQFEALIASRPDVSVSQKTIPVEVPSNCTYYSGSEAIVLTITKK